MASSHTPRRIGCLQPSATVILEAVGALDRVVACTRYCAEVVPEAANGNRVILSDSWSAEAAEIVAARPDLVIASVPYREKAIAEILKAGARFLALAPKSLSDIYTDIATISGIVGAAGEGERVIASMRKRIEEIRNRAAGQPRVRVFCEEWGKPLIASQPWVAELIDAAGGEFLGTPAMSTTAEEVFRFDPEVVIAAWCGAGDRVPLRKIVEQRGWQNTRAARYQHIFCVRDEYLNTPAPTLLHGLEALAFALHPELFPRTKGIRQITDETAP